MGPFLIGPQHHSEPGEKQHLSGNCGEPPVLPHLLLLSDKSDSFCKSQRRWWCLLVLPEGWALVPRSLGSGWQSHYSTHIYTIKIIFSFCLHRRQDIRLLSFCVCLLQLTWYLPILSTLQQTIRSDFLSYGGILFLCAYVSIFFIRLWMSGQILYHVVNSTAVNMKNADILFGMLVLFPLIITGFQCSDALLRSVRKASTWNPGVGVFHMLIWNAEIAKGSLSSLE